MPIANIASVLEHGILSHDQAARLTHVDVSMADVQNRRAGKAVPGGLRLHQYANLYLCARNPMMYRRQNERSRLYVLRVDRTVLELEGVVLTTGNAASDYSRFLPSPEGLRECVAEIGTALGDKSRSEDLAFHLFLYSYFNMSNFVY